MPDFLSKPCTAFIGPRQIAQGPLIDVALAVKAAEAEWIEGPVLVFDDATGSVIDLDLRGGTAEIVSRLTDRAKETETVGRHKADEPEQQPRPRGRPKIGVVPREVTLLPRHWEWLALQPGGASQALRRLVDQARRNDHGLSETRAARETAYRFMSAMAGNLPGFEEAARALFAGDSDRFGRCAAEWPQDIRCHAHRLAFGTSSATGET
jgi:hypothetical protein